MNIPSRFTFSQLATAIKRIRDDCGTNLLSEDTAEVVISLIKELGDAEKCNLEVNLYILTENNTLEELESVVFNDQPRLSEHASGVHFAHPSVCAMTQSEYG